MKGCSVTHYMCGCTFAMRKSGGHTKTLFLFTNKKVYSLTLFKESSGIEEQSIKTESTASAGQRETTYHEERKRGKILNYFSGFVLKLQRSCSLLSSSQLRVYCDTPIQSSPKNGTRNFRLSLHRLWLGFNSRLYLFLSPCQLTFSCLLYRIHCLMVFSFEFLSGIRTRYRFFFLPERLELFYRDISHCPDLQNCSLTIRYCLVSDPIHSSF